MFRIGAVVTELKRGEPLLRLPERLRLEQVAAGLLVIVLIGTLEIPDLVILVTNAPIPWMGHDMPYMAPILFAVLVFNIAVVGRLHAWRFPVLPDTVLFVLFVVAFWAIEFGHWVVEGAEVESWMLLSLFWVLVYYLVLRSFDHYLTGGRNRVVTITIALSLIMATAQFITTINGRGSPPAGFNNAQLFDSARVAYPAVFAFALILFELPHARTWLSSLLRYGLLAPFLVLIAYNQRLTGANLLIWILVFLKTLSLLSGKALRTVVVVSALLVLAVVVQYEDDPTVQGLKEGVYFYDELGALHGDILSSFIRRESIVQNLRLFFESPLFGVGMAAASKVRVLLLGMHSSLIYVLTSTGLVGFGLLALWLSWSIIGAVRIRGMQALALPIVLGAYMLLTAEPVWWWSTLMYLVSTPRSDKGTSAHALSANDS